MGAQAWLHIEDAHNIFPNQFGISERLETEIFGELQNFTWIYLHMGMNT